VKNLTLGWLGTGRMGTALADRLLAGTSALAVWNRTAARTAPLVERGATAVGQVADLCKRDVVFVTVLADGDLAQVMFGEDGLLGGPSRPRVVVDCSTVSAETSALVRSAAEAAGTAYLAAPVSGNPAVVAAGRANMVVSGPRATYDLVRPYLDMLAQNVVHVGEAEQARLIKLCHNLYLGMMVQALVEVTTLAEKGGTDAAAFLKFLSGTVLASEWIRLRSSALAEHDWTTTFPVTGLEKDLDLGLAAAKHLSVPMPVAATVQQLVRAAAGAGLGEQDLLALYQQQASTAGLWSGS
jgi:3-hydroxyisobutyrate dehydrogenase-like beta-hydroxyacid dehydrogenase